MAAFAEVSEKIPAEGLIWTVGIAGGLLCAAAGYWKRGLILVAVLLPALWFISLLLEVHSPDISPAIYNERGPGYYLHAYAALLVVVVGAAYGWWVATKRKAKQAAKHAA
jgi:hypothetical protein